jgi:hypothetical protein
MLMRINSRVEFRPETQQILIDGGEYVIHVGRLTTTGECLDRLLEVKRKDWADSEVLKRVLDALEAACEWRFGDTAQGVFCPWGQHSHVHWHRRTRELEAV